MIQRRRYLESLGCWWVNRQQQLITDLPVQTSPHQPIESGSQCGFIDGSRMPQCLQQVTGCIATGDEALADHVDRAPPSSTEGPGHSRSSIDAQSSRKILGSTPALVKGVGSTQLLTQHVQRSGIILKCSNDAAVFDQKTTGTPRPRQYFPE